MTDVTTPDDVTTADGERSRLVEDLFADRRSTRAFLPDPVPPAVLDRLLAVAARTASNSNSQPWHVHVVGATTRSRLAAAIGRSLDRGEEFAPEYEYQPGPDEWPEPLDGRRRAFGAALYGDALQVDRDDTAAREAHHRRNYEFFGAPVGIVLTVDRGARSGGLVDAGAFLHALTSLAQARGIGSCAQASFNDFHPLVRRELDLPDTEVVVCGLSLGYADPDHPVNTVVTERLAVDEFRVLHD